MGCDTVPGPAVLTALGTRLCVPQGLLGNPSRAVTSEEVGFGGPEVSPETGGMAVSSFSLWPLYMALDF